MSSPPHLPEHDAQLLPLPGLNSLAPISPVLPLPIAFSTGLHLGLLPGLRAGLAREVFGRLNGDLALCSGEMKLPAESRTIGWAALTAEDRAGNPQEAIMVFGPEGEVCALRMERSVLSLALLRRFMIVTGGGLTWTKDAIGLHPDERVPPGAAALPPESRWTGFWKKRGLTPARRSFPDTLQPVSLVNLGEAAQDMQRQDIFPDAAFLALHATLLQGAMGNNLPKVVPGAKKVRL